MTVRHCPLCNSPRLTAFLHRQHVPVHQNLVVPSQESACSVTRGDIDLVVCSACGFVFNRSFDPSLLQYGEHYDNAQYHSPYFDAYLDSHVSRLLQRIGATSSTIVEVGCGNGHFLRKLIDHSGGRQVGYGFDPSYVGPDTDLDGRLEFRRSYYDETCVDIVADVVICRHVIEHVPSPLRLLETIRDAMANNTTAQVFFETPCVEWILRNRMMWDFYYEHCSLFTAKSLAFAFESCGFAIEGVEHVFGGQYLWLEARPSSGLQSIPKGAKDTLSLASAYSANDASLQMKFGALLRELGTHGKIALWGAGAKGATFANLIDRDCQIIDSVADINPNKQGRFLPGSGHPIVSPADLGHRGVRSVVLMNPNYRDEVTALLATLGLQINVIDWVL